MIFLIVDSWQKIDIMNILMSLSFYNTKTRSVEDFTHSKDAPVTMYNCGPTVYNYAHIGNLRSYFFADSIRRTLEWNGYAVRQIVNITDVGHLVGDADEGADKMRVAVERENKTAADIARQYTDQFFKDIAAINFEHDGTLFPKATDHIAEQIALITRLEEQGYAYRTADGIYFDTAKFGLERYARFANLDLQGMKEGARVVANRQKRNPSDFALWKFWQSDDTRLQEWESPWGTGFPGWHIECSAMSMNYLGETIDIHTGGIDHIPVHHTNEIAQSEAATGHEFAKLWMHSAHMTVNGQKMSKSLGNTYRLDDLRSKGITPLAFRYWLLTAHYRSTINFTWDAIAGAQNALERIYDFLREDSGDDSAAAHTRYRSQFEIEINNDLMMPKALAILWALLKDDAVDPAAKRATLLEMDRVLGLGFVDIQKKEIQKEIPEEIQKLALERAHARAARDFIRSDALRDRARLLGYEISDTSEGQKIRKME